MSEEFQEEAVRRAKEDALEWLQNNKDGYPRSWQEVARGDKLRGYVMYDDGEVPPIAGYEALEREGVVVRMETVMKGREERIHFRMR